MRTFAATLQLQPMTKNDPFKELYDSIHGNNELLRIMETSVPISVQTAYFKMSNSIRLEEHPFNLELWRKRLLSDEVDEDSKKRILVLLSGSKNIEAFRFLEAYSKTAKGVLAHWSALALLEARVQIESDILGERPVIVASGLGGKENKLRFFVVLATVGGADLTLYQERMLEKELSFYAKKQACEIEEIRIHSHFATVLVLLPVDIENPGLLFDKVIDECNAYGNFLRKDYVLTNIRILSDSEICRTLRRANR